MLSIAKSQQSLLVDAMKHSEFYPEHPARVECRQTHLSYVFLAGSYVYKIKKPLRFDFADYSTLAIRYELCREEVRLNRRLAAEVYLGVVPIFRSARRFLLGDASTSFDAKAHEYAVKMRRLPDDRMLDRLVRSGEVNRALIGELARKLARFHRSASTAAGRRYGSAAAVSRSMLGNLEEGAGFLDGTTAAGQYAALAAYFKGFVAAHRDLLNDRVRQGYVRDGHGDLRCEHICVTNGIQVFDCLEFSERLRYADVASDTAFLSMDLDFLGAPRLSDELVRAYAEETGDEKFPTLINFYKCYRACVRGKVERLRSLEDEVPAAEREQACDRARAHFSLASAYASRGRPALVIVCGLSGTGKSTVAQMLQYRTGFDMLNSDRVRKRVAGIAETSKGSAPYRAGIYSSPFDRLTYDTILAEAESLLRMGRGVVIDATFKRAEDRHSALVMGVRAGEPVLFVECRADEAEILRRIVQRTCTAGPSDATTEVYLRQRSEFVPLTEISSRQHLIADTTKGVDCVWPSIERALNQLFE